MLRFSAHRRSATGNAHGTGVLADREPVEGSRLGYVVGADNTAGQATQTIADAARAMASTVGLFSDPH